MYYLKMSILVPIALAWDLIFGTVTMVYKGFAWVDKVVGHYIEEVMQK